MKIKPLFLILLLFTNFLICNTEVVDELNKKSHKKYDLKQYKEAIKISRKAQNLAKLIGYNDGLLTALIEIAEIYINLIDLKMQLYY